MRAGYGVNLGVKRTEVEEAEARRAGVKDKPPKPECPSESTASGLEHGHHHKEQEPGVRSEQQEAASTNRAVRNQRSRARVSNRHSPWDGLTACGQRRLETQSGRRCPQSRDEEFAEKNALKRKKNAMSFCLLKMRLTRRNELQG